MHAHSTPHAAADLQETCAPLLGETALSCCLTTSSINALPTSSCQLLIRQPLWCATATHPIAAQRSASWQQWLHNAHCRIWLHYLHWFPVTHMMRATQVALRQFKLRTGSGGTGRWHGGNGVIREVCTAALTSLRLRGTSQHPRGLQDRGRSNPGCCCNMCPVTLPSHCMLAVDSGRCCCSWSFCGPSRPACCQSGGRCGRLGCAAAVLALLG